MCATYLAAAAIIEAEEYVGQVSVCQPTAYLGQRLLEASNGYKRATLLAVTVTIIAVDRATGGDDGKTGG